MAVEREALLIEARMIDEASKVLNDIGIESEKTGRKGQKAFKKFGDSVSARIVTLNQFFGLLGKVRRGFGILAKAALEPIRMAGLQEQAEVKLAATLKATAGAAGLEARELLALANQIQATTALSNDLVIEAEAILLTFKQIGTEAFPRALKAAADMNALLGTELRGAVIQLGKALNDPILGVTALNRVGITFTNTQREMIKGLVRNGQLLKAQSIILDEVEGQLAGVSDAMGNTFLGILTNVGNAWGDLLKAVGAFVVESPVVRGALKGIIALFGEWEKTLRETDGPMKQFRETIDGFIRGAIPALINGFAAIIDAAFELAIAVEGLIAPLRTFFDLAERAFDFAGAWDTIKESAKQAGREVKSAFVPMADSRPTALVRVNEETNEAITAMRKLQGQARETLSSLSREVEAATGGGSILDKFVGAEKAEEAKAKLISVVRGIAGSLADIGFTGLRTFSIDPAQQARAAAQQAEFENQLLAINKTATDLQVDEITERYDAMIGAQREALALMHISEEGFNRLQAATIAKRNAEIDALFAEEESIRMQAEMKKDEARSKELEKERKQTRALLDERQKRLRSIEDMINTSIDVTRSFQRTELENAIEAERQRFSAQAEAGIKIIEGIEERQAFIEIIGREHLARVTGIEADHRQKKVDADEAAATKAEALAARERQRQRDQVEFQRDLALQVEVFQREGADKRLAELNRSFENEKAAILQRAETLKLDAESVAQFMEALTLEHNKATMEITGTASEGVTAALEQLRNARETEFEAARNDTLAIVSATKGGLTDMFTDVITGAKSTKDAFKDMAASVLSDIARIAAQRAVTSLFGGFSFADGGIMQGQRQSSAEFRAFANGGVARRPTMALFAEVPGMAEAFVPLPDGQRIPVKMDISGLRDKERAKPSATMPEQVNIGFEIHAVDAQGVDQIIEKRRGAIVGMMVEALRTIPAARDAVRQAVGNGGL